MGDRKFANTLARGLSVLRAFRVSDDGLTRTEIVVRTGLAPATITRLTHTLLALGYLSQNGNLLRLGPAAFALSSVVNASSSFLDFAHADLQSLANRTKTMVLMSVADGNSMTLVRVWHPEGVTSVWLEQGNRVPITNSSTGQAFLAAISNERLTTLESQPEWKSMRQEGRAQLARLGFTYVARDTRYDQSTNAVAHPMYTSSLGDPIVFSCGAPPELMTEAYSVDVVGPALRDVVRHLELKTSAPRTYIES